MWEFGSAEVGSVEAQTYLNEGWEPFAVTSTVKSTGLQETSGYRRYYSIKEIWLRRQIEK